MNASALSPGAGAKLGITTGMSAPPIGMISRNPMANRSGVLSISCPRHIVNTQLNILTPVGTAIRIWDSSAEMRYMVLPQRPAGTDGLGFFTSLAEKAFA